MKDAYDRALEINGIDWQIDQAIEEMGELLIRLSNYRRQQCEKTTVCEEIADVYVSLRSLKRYFGEEEVDIYICQKVDRLGKRLDAKENMS